MQGWPPTPRSPRKSLSFLRPIVLSQEREQIAPQRVTGRIREHPGLCRLDCTLRRGVVVGMGTHRALKVTRKLGSKQHFLDGNCLSQQGWRQLHSPPSRATTGSRECRPRAPHSVPSRGLQARTHTRHQRTRGGGRVQNWDLASSSLLEKLARCFLLLSFLRFIYSKGKASKTEDSIKQVSPRLCSMPFMATVTKSGSAQSQEQATPSWASMWVGSRAPSTAAISSTSRVPVSRSAWTESGTAGT